jgi:Sec-independent protein translocase protein TatA
VGFGVEILFVLMLGLLVLGPKRLHAMLVHVARARTELEHATRDFKSQLAAELDAAPRHNNSDCSMTQLAANGRGGLPEPPHPEDIPR